MFRSATLAVLTASLLAVSAAPVSALAIPEEDGLLPTVDPTPTPPAPVSPQVSEPKPWYFGFMLRRTATPFGSGLRIDTVRTGGPAARAGLEPGDVLLAAGESPLQEVRSKVQALGALRGAVAEQPLPPGACPHDATPSGQVVLTVLDGRTGGLSQVLVEPIVRRRHRVQSNQPTVVSNGSTILSIPATFDPVTGQRLSPPPTVTTRTVGFGAP